MKPLSTTIVKNRSSAGTFKPQLTSLIDVMTILLVFLIKNMAVDGQLITASSDINLPVSSSRQPPRPQLSIEITAESVIASGQILANVKKMVGSSSMEIPALLQWLKAEQALKPDSSGEKEVLLQCDRELEFSIVKKVMYTCNKAGFSDFSILALEDE